MHSRGERIQKTLIKEISDIIQHKLKDPRITGIISVTDVELSPDYKYAKAYISIFAEEETKKDIMSALEECTSYVRREVSKRIKIRHTPELKFVRDDSIERARKIEDIIDQIAKEDLSKKGS